MSNPRKRYAIVGTGGRAVEFMDALAGKYREVSELVGFCDLSATRMQWYNDKLQKDFNHPPVPTYAAADFDRMIAEQKPDVVIVTTMDSVHHEYIVRAMELGCDAITEKPMTTDAAKAKAIFDAIERTGRNLRVTFNYRYSAPTTKVRQLIRDGVIGTPTAVDFTWVLDTMHGADYFRRWHREKRYSGGLLVHKSTHHFDMVNWWIASKPETVFAMGGLKFYGRQNAEQRNEKQLTAYDRYTGQADAKKDPFSFPLDADANLKGLYLDAEKDSGYIRDRNVFGDNIDAEDTMAVMARYRNGVVLNYSLVAYSPWEGFRAAISGTKGRIEFYERHGSHVIKGQDGQELAAAQAAGEAHCITVFPMFGQPYEVEIEKVDGGHGGGDPIILDQLFNPAAPPDPYERAASHVDGAASILVGICANESIATGKPVVCDDMLRLS